MKTQLTETEFLIADINNDNSYNFSEINRSKKIAEDVKNLGFDAEIVYNISIEDGKKYFQHTSVIITHVGLKFFISLDDYRKKYTIYSADVNQLTNIDNYIKSDIRKTISSEEPNQIGVLSVKKILAHLDYQTKFYNLCLDKNNTNADKIADFIKSLEGIEGIQYWNNNKSGRIEKNGISFEFNILNTCVDTKVRLTTYNNTLDSFLKLSDNKYTK